MADVLRVGDVLDGFCGGVFGRDSYYDQRVEALGADWVVVRPTDEYWAEMHGPNFAQCNPEDLLQYRKES